MDPAPFSESISTARITLTKHDPARAAEMFAAIDADRERLGRFLPWVQWTHGAADEGEYIRVVTEQWARGEFFDYAMLDGEGRYFGNIGVHTINRDTLTAEIGYWILGSHEGRGLASEAAAALVEHAFAVGLHRIEIRCDPANARSAALPRRLGFVLEARLRRNAVDRFGSYHDTLVFGRLAGEGAPVPLARPGCVRTWAELSDGPRASRPDSLEMFGAVAPLAARLDLTDLDVEHVALPPGQRTWVPVAESTRQTLICVIEGRPRLWLDGRLHDLVAGDVVGLRAGDGTAHTILNNDGLDAGLLVVRSRPARPNAVHHPRHPELRTRVAAWWDPDPAHELGDGDDEPVPPAF